MTRYIIGALLAVAIFICGYLFGGSHKPQHIESIKVDTITIERVTPKEISPKVDNRGEVVTLIERVPIVEVVDTVIIVDTLLAQIPLQTYSFEGESWRSQISGYAVSIESMEIYNTTTTIVKPPSWELSAVVGITPNARWIGGSATRRWGRVHASLNVGYDLKNGSPFVGVMGGVALFYND